MKLTSDQENDCWNKAMTMLNRGLNQGVEWDCACDELIAYFEKKKEQYDESFEVDEANPLLSEATWTTQMDLYDYMINIFKQKKDPVLS